MSDEAPKTVRTDGDGFAGMSSEEIEVRAIEDATRGSATPADKGTPETEQDVEYQEKRELAVDERENFDPTEH